MNIHERTEIFTVEPLETVYFRFFVSEEYGCKPFKFTIRPFYGTPAAFLSNLYPIPSIDNAQWRDGRIPPAWGWGQTNMLVVCPNSHTDYQLGTYSLAVFSWFSSSFDVEITFHSQDYPLVPPPGRILCEDVPESELTAAQAGSSQPVFCLQDTETLQLSYNFSVAGSINQFVLPIPAGFPSFSFSLLCEKH